MSSDIKRLLEEGADPFEQSLLASAKRDRMSPEAAQTLAAALGVTTVCGTAAGLGGSVVASSSVAPKAIASMPAAKIAAIFGWKTVLLAVGGAGLLLGGAVVAFATLSRHPGENGAPRSAAVAVASMVPTARMVPIPAPDAPLGATEAPSVEAEATSATIPSSPAPAKRSARAPRSAHELPSPAETATNDVAAEVRLVERARRALASGDLTKANALLDDYERSFPHGSLAQEAAILRIDALALSGDRTATEHAVAAYLAAHPRSPHAARLRAMIAAP